MENGVISRLAKYKERHLLLISNAVLENTKYFDDHLIILLMNGHEQNRTEFIYLGHQHTKQQHSIVTLKTIQFTWLHSHQCIITIHTHYIIEDKI
jgi:hypothetical protein